MNPNFGKAEANQARHCGVPGPTSEHPCPAGKTGPGCALICDHGAGSACGYTEYCDSDGRVAGLVGRRASLFQTTTTDAAERFATWVTTNPSAFGLRSDIEQHAVAFEIFDVSKHGPLFLITLTQRYRGLPLLGPEGVLVLSGHGGAVTLANGTVVDGSVPYANLDEQCSAELAAKALRHHVANSDDEAAEIELNGPHLYAIARSQRLVWAAHASRNSAYLGLFAVDAAPINGPNLPKLVYMDRGVHAGLDDEMKITALSHDLTALPYGLVENLPTVVNDTISTGSFLTGSTVPGGIQLASPRVFMRDLNQQTLAEGLVASDRIVSPDGVFLAASDPDLAAQRIYHLYQSFYDITDRYLSVAAEPTLKQWDSHLGATSSFAPGTYQPRIVVFTSSAEKCLNQPACAGAYPIIPPVLAELPEFDHSADGGILLERIGYTHFKNNKVGVDVVAHEFGHVVDSFLFPGTAAGTTCMLDVDCVAKCDEDTPDEAPALSEAVAQLLALLYWYEASSAIGDQDCAAVAWVSSNGAYAGTPGPCMADLGQIAYMVRDADCPVPDAGFCDKPEGIGFIEICCDIDADPECLQVDPSCASNGGGSRLAPTGACTESPGYRSNSTLEAYWQLLIGQTCAPDAPFTCAPIVLSGDVSPSEAAARALFYALRVNSRSFRQLFDNLAAYYSCEYGAAAYDGVRAVLCNHRIMDCAAPPPLQCGECGDAVVDAGEQCDLTSIPVTCEDLGYDGGDVSCSLTCEIEEDGCFHAGPTTAGPTGTGAESSSESGAGADTNSAGTSVGTPDPGGCACRQRHGSPPGIPISLGLIGLALLSKRRKTS